MQPNFCKHMEKPVCVTNNHESLSQPSQIILSEATGMVTNAS